MIYSAQYCGLFRPYTTRKSGKLWLFYIVSCSLQASFGWQSVRLIIMRLRARSSVVPLFVFSYARFMPMPMNTTIPVHTDIEISWNWSISAFSFTSRRYSQHKLPCVLQISADQRKILWDHSTPWETAVKFTYCQCTLKNSKAKKGKGSKYTESF